MPYDEDAFPELRYTELKRQAEAWIRDYPKVSIERIVLYRYRLKSRPASHPVKYFVVLEIQSPESVFECTARDAHMDPATDFLFQVIILIMVVEAYEELRAATGCVNTVVDKARDRTLLSADFDRAYKEAPRGNFRNEWRFFLKTPGQGLSERVRVDEPHWIIYEGGAKYSGHPERAGAFARDLWVEHHWIWQKHIAHLYLYANPDCTAKIDTVVGWIKAVHPDPIRKRKTRPTDEDRHTYFPRLLGALKTYRRHCFTFESVSNLMEVVDPP